MSEDGTVAIPNASDTESAAWRARRSDENEHAVTPAVAPRSRLIVSLLVGLISGHAVLLRTPHFGTPRDLVQFWFAARALLHGANPYVLIGPGRALDYGWPFVYPLTSAVGVLPLAGLTSTWACAVFAGIGGACFAWALMAFGYAPLLALVSVCYWHAIFVVQWSPLLAASVVLAPLAFFLIAKPTTGLAYFVARPSWWAIVGAVVLTGTSFALDPHWVAQWREALSRAVSVAKHGFPYHVLLLKPGGILVLAALTRWRRPEARLLIALACVPHTPLPYDLLPLFLIPRGWWQSASLLAMSYVMWWLVSHPDLPPDFYQTVIEYARASIPCMYLPCTLMVLRRENAGPLPSWLEKETVRWPSWLRGSSVSLRPA